jgi:hypothetical protein
MKKYIVVAVGYNYVEAEAVLADSKEDAIFRANMKASTFVLCDDISNLKKFLTDLYIGSSGWNYICQKGDGVEIGHTNTPFYNDQPHSRLDVCEAINRLIHKTNNVSHIILGDRLPTINMAVCCYCDCGESASIYF